MPNSKETTMGDMSTKTFSDSVFRLFYVWSTVIIMLLYTVCNILLNNTNNLHINFTVSENQSVGCNERKVPFRSSPAIRVSEHLAFTGY